MRVKAARPGPPAAEDYQNDKTLEDGDLLYSGSLALPQDFWTKAGKNVESWQSGVHMYYHRRAGGGTADDQPVRLIGHRCPSLYARDRDPRQDGAGGAQGLRLPERRLGRERATASRTSPELMDPRRGLRHPDRHTAGNGQDADGLAAGLTQVLDERRYTDHHDPRDGGGRTSAFQHRGGKWSPG